MNKRGEEGSGTSLGTIITFILLALVLVFVLFSFTTSGRQFWAKLLNIGGGTTLDSAVTGCNLAASSNSYDSFCAELRQVEIGGKTQYVTCEYVNSIKPLEPVLSCSSHDMLVANCKALNKINIIVNSRNITAVSGAGSCDQLQNG